MAAEGIINAIAEYLQKEGRVIKGAPVAFGVGVALVGAVVFGLLDWHYSAEVRTQAATIENQKSHIAVLEEENKGVLPQQAAINVKRQKIVEQLQKFYVESTPILNANLPKTISADDFAKYQTAVNDWITRTATWIQQNMGEPARDRFLDYGQGFSFSWNRAVNEQHNNDINLIGAYRKNLSSLIESNAWDRIPDSH
jgi:predicted RNA-binding protein Jag